MDLTTILKEWKNPDADVRERLLEAVYQELRRLARSQMRRERGDHTLTPTALVHEAYMRIGDDQSVSFADRHEFFALAATVMRRVLIDHARTHLAGKRGGGAPKVELHENAARTNRDAEEVLAVHEALSRLAELDPAQARIVELRYFGGFTTKDIAALMGNSEQDVDREWRLARAWLKRRLAGSFAVE
jgi:RNA polymerase sigma-70 factor, ECF subfamily